jgi:hypothetical protein
MSRHSSAPLCAGLIRDALDCRNCGAVPEKFLGCELSQGASSISAGPAQHKVGSVAIEMHTGKISSFLQISMVSDGTAFAQARFRFI